MKLARYSGEHGEIGLGLANGEMLHPLAEPDLAAALQMMAGETEPRLTDSPISLDEVQVRGPVTAAPKVLCIGLNYQDHAAESGLEPPVAPLVFSKFASSLIGPGEDVVVPAVAEQIDWEAELAVVIGRSAREVPEARALDHVAGYANFNDVTSRALQFNGGGQWTLGKALDTFGPIGPYIVGKDEVHNPQNLGIRCTVDDELVQSSNTSAMIFGVAELIAFLSSRLTLLPGDIIATGTPAGVGMGRKPPRYLRDGQRMSVEIAGLGILTNTVRITGQTSTRTA